MRSFIIISAVCMQLWSHGVANAAGVGAYAYQDSAGNRYGGTYGLKNGQVYNIQGDGFPAAAMFAPVPFVGDFSDVDSFFPEYFRNFQNIIQEAFAKNAEQQQLALNAATKAYDLTSNQAGSGYFPNFGFGSRFGAIPNFGFGQGFGMPGFENRFGGPALGPNSAFAGGAVAPGYRHQMVSINPANPKMPNIDVTQFSDTPRSGNGFYSVSSTSYSSSSNLNGKEENSRGGETVVNDNGKVTKYKLNN